MGLLITCLGLQGHCKSLFLRDPSPRCNGFLSSVSGATPVGLLMADIVAGSFFFKFFLGTWVLFVGPLIPLFWTSGDVSGFQSQNGQPYSSLAEAYVLQVPWNSPLVWHLPTSWQPAYLQGIGGTRNRELSCRCSQCQIRQARRSTDWAIHSSRVFLMTYLWLIIFLWLSWQSIFNSYFPFRSIWTIW